LNGHEANRAGSLEKHPALGCGAIVRAQIAGNARRSARDRHDDFAFQFEAGEVVELHFGNRQAVPRKHKRRLHGVRRVVAQRDRRVFAEDEPIRLPVADQFETALRLDDPAGVELDRLQISVDAGRRKARLLELRRDVLGGLAMLGTACLAPLHPVVRQRFHV